MDSLDLNFLSENYLSENSFILKHSKALLCHCDVKNDIFY